MTAPTEAAAARRGGIAEGKLQMSGFDFSTRRIIARRPITNGKYDETNSEAETILVDVEKGFSSRKVPVLESAT